MLCMQEAHVQFLAPLHPSSAALRSNSWTLNLEQDQSSARPGPKQQKLKQREGGSSNTIKWPVLQLITQGHCVNCSVCFNDLLLIHLYHTMFFLEEGFSTFKLRTNQNKQDCNNSSEINILLVCQFLQCKDQIYPFIFPIFFCISLLSVAYDTSGSSESWRCFLDLEFFKLFIAFFCYGCELKGILILYMFII